MRTAQYQDNILKTILNTEPVAKPAFLHKSDDFGASPRSAQIGISDWA
jgi:hypothetical protein